MKEIKNYRELNEREINITKIPNETFLLIPNSSDFKVYIYLCSKYDNENNNSSVSIKDISKETCLGLTTVKKSIKWLEKNHFIDKNVVPGYINNFDIYYMDSNIKEYEDDNDIIEYTIKVNESKRNKSKRKINHEYSKWRENVLERDNYTCRMCGKTEDEIILNAHHIIKYSDNEELRTNVNNGITLCYLCHREIFNKEKEFEEYFKELIKEDK